MARMSIIIPSKKELAVGFCQSEEPFDFTAQCLEQAPRRNNLRFWERRTAARLSAKSVTEFVLLGFRLPPK